MKEVQNILRIASTIACGIVLSAFVMWATDEGRTTSGQQVAQVDTKISGGSAPDANSAPAAAPAPEAGHGGVRGAIEDANEALLTPFDHIAQDGGTWPAHFVPALLALLTYGLLARILIGYLPR